jgi:hypothetical protein
LSFGDVGVRFGGSEHHRIQHSARPEHGFPRGAVGRRSVSAETGCSESFGAWCSSAMPVTAGGQKAAVMRYWLLARELFEGCEQRSGDRTPPLIDLRADESCGCVKHCEPGTGCGMQQARKLEYGVNRRGGAKPRGRNMQSVWRRLAWWACSPELTYTSDVGGRAPW